IAGKGMLAFRDPRGIRPLIMGKKVTLKGVSYAFASESIALDFLGYKVLKDVEPGEAVFISNDLKVYNWKLNGSESPAHCMFEWVYFSRPDSVIENKGVYEARFRLGEALAKQWAGKEHKIDVVVPVPDSSRPVALGFATALNLTYREGLVKNRYVGRTFIMPSQKSRENAVRSKLSPIIKELKGKRVMLVDDSIVRGTTCKYLIKMIRNAGAQEVHFASACPPILHPCFYGVDMSSKKELIAANNSLDEIKEEIGADSLTYQSINGVVEGIGSIRDRLCLACLNGNYPTKISAALKREYGEMRINQKSLPRRPDLE
ncbi:MAG: amidophosphoribosyltransferase, partial [Candidatus Diapherotrites archaeon]|nr:amidophosphoribosyltransferase [Candidatus Diapherotrites archaeon]